MRHHAAPPVRSIVLCGLVLVAAACSVARAPSGLPAVSTGDQVVTLTPVPDSSPDRWWGLTNIFFSALPDSLRTTAHVGDGWTVVEVADVVEGGDLKPIYVARFKPAGSDTVRYVIDTAGNLDFVHGRSLAFQRRRGVRVADLELEVKTNSGVRRRLPYQVLAADDGYTYARIAEYRTGSVRIGEREYALKVRNTSRHDPFYGLGPGTVFLADLDGDGQIAEQVTVTAGGRAAAAEEVLSSAPFLLGGQAVELSAIDSLGTRLVVRPSRVQVAAFEGFKAPALAGDVLTGGRYQLGQSPGKVTLIEFWSTECGFSEKVRPAANALAATMPDTSFTWVAVVKERDRAAIMRHLAEHPMNAKVVLSDSATWAAYNPAGATPLFVVVDQRGVVRYRAAGASAIGGVAAKVRGLLGVPPT